MECPHCHTDLLYRNRGNRTCSNCKRKFALEPKLNDFRLHDLQFRRLIDQISNGGQFAYTIEQLRHRAGRKVAAANKPMGFVGCVVQAVFAALIGGVIVSVAADPVVGILMGFVFLVVLVGIATFVALGPYSYQLPINRQNFESQVIKRWMEIYQEVPRGLMTQQMIDQADECIPAPQSVRAVVASPSRDVLNCLRVNQVPRHLNIQLLPTDQQLTPTQKTTLERLRREPNLPLLLLHDASVDGCMLPYKIRQTFGLQANHMVIDLGLRPAEASRNNMLRLGQKPGKAALQYLEKQAKQTETPRGWPAPLTKQELEWLKQGFYTPILAATPARLISVVSRAVQRLHGTQRQETPLALSGPDLYLQEDTPEKQAAAVGFLSWPTA